MSESIHISNCGPVVNLEIPVQPGATILRGCSDIGKSETLKAISRLAGGKEEVSCRNGAAKGTVEGFGVKLGLSKTVRRTGTLEALAIEDGFGLGTLIDGDNLSTPEAADRARIKALLRISGAKADPTKFYAITPGGKETFEKHVSAKALETDDPVDMARKIKSEMEAAARKLETDAATEEGKATANRNAGDGLNLKAESDAATLQRVHTESVQRHASLKTSWDAYWNAQDAASEARKKLAEATGSGKTLEQYREAHKAAVDVLTNASRIAGEIQIQLDKANAEVGRAVQGCNAAREASEQAERYAKATEGWQKTIDSAAGGEQPNEDDLLAAETAVETARNALEEGVKIRTAKEKIAQATEHLKRAGKLREEAFSLREAAKETDSVLSAMVASPNLKVSAGRLITTVEGRGEVLFHERSDGTRTKIACMEKLHRIRQINSDQLAIIPIGQRQFGDLSPQARKDIIQWAYENNACILSAVVDDSPILTAEAATPLDP